MRVVFDTNIYISAFAISGGKAEDVYLKAVRGCFQLVASVAILTELATTLQKKFDWTTERTEALMTHLSNVAEVHRTKPNLHVL